jgi:hypothetical protein
VPGGYPSALLVCAYLSGTLTSTTGTEAKNYYFINCEQMNWNIPLVFSYFDTDKNVSDDGRTALVIKAGDGATFVKTTYADFLTDIATNKTEYDKLKGLYIVAFSENENTSPVSVPIIRVLNIENEGLIQNEGIIEIGE